MKAILGTMNIGQQVFGQDALKMLQTFQESGGIEIDTAYVYNEGQCEIIVGECLAQWGANNLSIATKVNPRVTGKLDSKAVIAQLLESLERMQIGCVDILYLHFPDKGTPIREAIKGCAELYSQGKFKELGVSNFPLSLVQEMMPICEELGCPKPTVFEGVYNALSRKAERELFPALDSLGMRFYAYNPLAGGMLTGKYHDVAKKPLDGRFALRAKSYQERYWKESYFEAVAMISKACEEVGISVVEAAYRWIANHSQLCAQRGDGVIIGASKLSQLEDNLSFLQAGLLPDNVVFALNSAWDLTSKDAPEYFRYYEKPAGVV